jgi:acyl carrier protein
MDKPPKKMQDLQIQVKEKGAFMTIEERVKKIIAYLQGLKDYQIYNISHLKEDLNMDSLDAVELTMALEEEFWLEIPDEEAEKLLTVGDIVSYIQDKSGA